MRENSIDELRSFFGDLKREHNGNVKTLRREQICVQADVFGLRNTDAASIDRIMEAIKKYL